MELALECPTSMLELVQPFADFDFILAGEYIKDSTYASYYQKSTSFKIVDNSVNEEGEPLPLGEIIKVYEDSHAHLLISPDWIGDSKRTLVSYKEASGKLPKGRVIGVVQGSTYEEALESFEVFKEAGLVAVPYDICSSKTDSPSIMGLRRSLLISNIPPDIRVHLLGFDSLNEFFWYSNKPNVVSIDTGIPILLGLENRDILDPLDSKEKPTLNQMRNTKPTKESWGVVCRNIALLRKYTK